MPHITDQWWVHDSTDDAYSDGKTARKSTEVGKGNEGASRNSQRDPHPTILLVTPGSPASTTFIRSPRQGNFTDTALTPKSAVSAIFDSPIKRSPSSSISSTESVNVITRRKTPVAELEDTSLGHRRSELADTSVQRTKHSAHKMTARYQASRTLVSALDQQFLDYEEENRQLKNSLTFVEKALAEARASVAEANRALLAAKQALSEQDCELDHRYGMIAELQKEVDHCHRHHLAPPPPAKPPPPTKYKKDTDRPFSRFNASSNCLSVSLTPGSISMGSHFSSSPTGGSPKSTGAQISSPAASLSAAGSPFQPRKYSNVPAPATYTPLTAKALSSALASAASTSTTKLDIEASSLTNITPLGFERPVTGHKPTPFSPSDIGRVEGNYGRSRSHSDSQPLQSSASNPNLRRQGLRHQGQTQGQHNSLPLSHYLPPLPATMSGGLPAPDRASIEINAYRLRKRRGGIGGLFTWGDQSGNFSQQ